MLARIFSSVLLPEPFGPTIAEELALVDVERDVAQRAVLAVLDARQRMRAALLERVDAVLGDAERLVEAAGLDHDRAVALRSRGAPIRSTSSAVVGLPMRESSHRGDRRQL